MARSHTARTPSVPLGHGEAHRAIHILKVRSVIPWAAEYAGCVIPDVRHARAIRDRSSSFRGCFID